MVRERLKKIFPSWQNALLALLAAGLLILAFPDVGRWWIAWFALVPLMLAVERQKHCVSACFLLGWLFGTLFFFGTCWWLTYAPIHYAAMPWPLAYLLICIVCLISGIFPGIFSLILAVLLRRFGAWAFFTAPFVWVFTEFARYWLTGNNWNAIAYSQAFVELWMNPGRWTATIGGVLLASGVIVLANAVIVRTFVVLKSTGMTGRALMLCFGEGIILFVLSIVASVVHVDSRQPPYDKEPVEMPWQKLVVIQPNVPMSGLDRTKWTQLRQKQIEMAETALKDIRTQKKEQTTTVVLPESPMNFAYGDDPEFRKYIGDFAARNNVSVLFNSSQPDKTNGRYFNSAVMVGPDGRLTAQYDKIYLLPFGEAVPAPLENIVPAFVGHFSYGSKYDLMPLGDAKVGVMICFESHFGELGRRYVQNGADAIIEMTNDGYLGPTPVLRQHLANAIFRAIETDRPVVRVTNVGITEFISSDGDICDSLITCGPPPYTEDTRVWAVSKSDGSQTFYVRYGDWFAWVCTIVTILLVAMSFKRKRDDVLPLASANGMQST